MSDHRLSTVEIKERLKELNVSPLFLNDLRNDKRKSVQKLLKSYDREQKKVESLKELYDLKCFYENQFWKKECLVAGVDEVGRGCLAGPVVCAAVILDPKKTILGIDDSKKLSVTRRQSLYKEIKKNALSYSVSIISVQTIDTINILEASRLGMKQAVNKLTITPSHLLVDALNVDLKIPQTTLIKGDSKSASIGAASILAKVFRDELMERYDSFYPDYDFKKNKGYGTKNHLIALNKVGASPIHRKSFSPVQKIIS